MSQAGPLKLDRARSAVLLVDVQTRLAAAMNPDTRARVMNRLRALLQGANALGLPVILTEQYPKGLGPTEPSLRALVPDAKVFEKLVFSAAIPEVREALGGRDQVLVAGMEAHVCVFQTVRDLCAEGRHVFLCADGVLSRNRLDFETGLALSRAAGAVVTTVESALFDLLEVAGTPAFKAVSQAVK